MLKAYVFRLYPNDKQKQIINQIIGNSRFIYNYYLSDKIKEYKESKKSKTAYDQIKLGWRPSDIGLWRSQRFP
ncbi:MAG: helix-turn-helix domain-containing protein [Bacilli bacterium]|nr:helix-turn-helix domain-containing protein [Bacilli bacterium]